MEKGDILDIKRVKNMKKLYALEKKNILRLVVISTS